MTNQILVALGLGLTCLVGSLPAVAAIPTTYPPSISEAEVRALMDRTQFPRPRLLMKPDQVRQLRDRVTANARLREIADVVRRDADAMIEAAPIARQLEGRRLLGESRRAVRRVIVLAMAYHLTGNRAYADRAAREMLAAAAFTDWNPGHFLDVGEMTLALGMGYDWLYDQLDPAARDTIRAAILSKGVRVPLDTPHNGWTRAANNWGQVCHAGMVAGALSVLEDDREAAAKTVHRALANVPRSMAAFAPKGSYPEGPGYWSYGSTFNVLLIAILESALGSSFGLDQAPGFDQTGAYLALTTGPSGLTFNYADGGSGRGVEPAVHWFAARYSRPEWLTGEAAPMRRRLSARPDGISGSDRFLPLLLLWLQDDSHADVARLPLHWTSDCMVPIALHRSSWTDPKAVFVGIKAGSPSGPHGHMDIGSFVLDAEGVRWATDLGAEGYHRIESRGMNFWSMAQESQRWTVFRQGSLSHNTLVIDDQLQQAAGHASIVRFSASPDFPHSVVDMSAVYAGQAATAHRGIALLPTGEVLVRDRLTGLQPGVSVRWGMVTPATAVQPGARSLELRQQDVSLTLRILQPTAATWALLDTAKPKNEWDSPNRGTVMTAFTVTAPTSGILDLAVQLIPGNRPATPADRVNLKPPLDWSAPR
ncbi:MAG: heparinase [Verrucomicrobia bacterium]|nr:heparinase [Verrucomicrobiota bacterium]